MRRIAVPALACIVLTLLVWSGWHNRRARNLAAHRDAAQAALAVLKTETGAETSLRGKAAPGFKLVDLDGKKVSLSDYKGRPVLVNFWGASCVPCKMEMPWLEEFRQRYAAQGFEILGIESEDASQDAVHKVIDAMKVNYPILLPGTGKVADSYDVQALPMSFYVDRKGVVVDQAVGVPAIDGKEAVEDHIRKLLSL
jgi:peroxiredoxin